MSSSNEYPPGHSSNASARGADGGDGTGSALRALFPIEALTFAPLLPRFHDLRDGLVGDRVGLAPALVGVAVFALSFGLLSPRRV